MATKKYFTVFNDGTQDLYIKDEEARDSLPTLAQESDIRAIVTSYTPPSNE